LSTEKPPHNHKEIDFPIKGIAEKRFVITVAPQKLICPQGRTYPVKAVAIISINMTKPEYQTNRRGYA
jgi:hypothetical protein